MNVILFSNGILRLLPASGGESLRMTLLLCGFREDHKPNSVPAVNAGCDHLSKRNYILASDKVYHTVLSPSSESCSFLPRHGLEKTPTHFSPFARAARWKPQTSRYKN